MIRFASRASCARPLFLLAILACHGQPTVLARKTINHTEQSVANLHAFARLYGVVRWFHPSDTAGSVDWDRFAIEGVSAVIDAPDAKALRITLTERFRAIAPTVQLAGTEEQFSREPTLQPSSTVGLELVAWEHRGFGDSSFVSGYASKRRNRARISPVQGIPFIAISQGLDASPFRGARIRLRGALRVANHGLGQIWLRVDRGDTVGFFDNMDAHPVISSEWKTAEIVGEVEHDATRIMFGTFMSTSGTAWYDDIELAVQVRDGTWKVVEIPNPGFESPNLFASWKSGTSSTRVLPLDGWNVVLDSSKPASGGQSLRVERMTKLDTAELFSDLPTPGEAVEIDLGYGLRARVPLVLYSRAGRTLGDEHSASALLQAGSSSPAGAKFDSRSGIADVIVLWNVLQHFWPYWDIVSVDWSAKLDAALADAMDDRNMDDHVTTLQRLSAAAPDGHARTTCRGYQPPESAPFVVELVEGKIVVTMSAVDDLQRGDVIRLVDGRSAEAELQASEALISGSPQWRRLQATRLFAAGSLGSRLKLSILRAGKPVDVTLTRGPKAIEENSRPPIDRLNDGVYYVDLSRASSSEVSATLDALKTAPGIVFDVRRTPKPNQELLSHLLVHPDNSNAWMAIPLIRRPDHTSRSVPNWEERGWSLPVREPHIGGRVAFLTGPAAISYTESLMSFVEHYHLGEIVGSATAGTNGNIAEVAEPTGCRTRFTGMRVTKHDGTRHHLVGILPTIPSSRTISGIVAGRDEILERALTYIRTGN
jgi:hypothetical protein